MSAYRPIASALMPAEERTLTSGAPRHKGGGCENGSRLAGRSGSGSFDPGVGGTKTAMDCLDTLAQYSLPLLCHKRLITTSLL